jgi:sterol desaturase/sphingolipid hydroxylase (fatty acid hydroxylase superfamily)
MLLQAIVVLAIPAFLAAAAVEHVLARRRGLSVYRLDDTLASLGSGIAQQVSLVFVTGALLGVYEELYAHHRLVTFAPRSPWPWIIGFVVGDLVFYWWHRASHEVGLLWASHVVHHQSEEYNLTVALRQAIASSVTSAPFYLPAALLGVPTATNEVLIAVSALYQFWLHTRLVGKLGPLERVLNTPSNHRVHHAVNPRYLDRNYGGMLVVWDRLFGTYGEERGVIRFGVTKRFASYHPLRAQVEGWVELWRRARAVRGLDRLRVLVRSPGWAPPGVAAPSAAEAEAALAARPPLPARATPGVRRYVLGQFVPLCAGTLVLLIRQGSASLPVLVAAALFVSASLLTLGGLLDGCRWAVPAEIARLAVVAAMSALLASGPLGPEGAGALSAALAIAPGAWLLAATRSQPAATSQPVASGI